MKANKTIFILISSLSLSFAQTVIAEEQFWENRIGVSLGQKHLDADSFEDDRHPAFGLSADLKMKSWPVSLAIDLMSSGDEKKPME